MRKLDSVDIRSWVLVPGILTLAVTLFRLAGELLHWSDFWFSPSAGGGGSPVGISWLVPFFGAYWGWRLTRLGLGPVRRGKTIGMILGALVFMIASSVVGFILGSFGVAGTLIGLITPALAIYIAFQPWKELGTILLAYGFVARVPVVLIMLLSIYGDWGTHYDAPPPNYTGTEEPFLKWLAIGVRFQLFGWIAFTSVIGGLFGAIASVIAARKAG